MSDSAADSLIPLSHFSIYSSISSSICIAFILGLILSMPALKNASAAGWIA